MQNLGSVLGAGHRRPLIEAYESHGLSALAAWRLAAPMTRQVLSALSGIAIDDIARIERSERPASPFEASQLALCLGAEPEDLSPLVRA
ncbi:helix-turn-helix transcriptional regulator [Frigidibacter sp. MR17.14]|uniref:helix-turn-helix domain-containing protein n=1 Tax=Frigidibacter sp. MR17.14 TaxID=3126509 RepID=UPI0030131BC9